MSRRTRRTGIDEPLMQLEDVPKIERTQSTIKLTPEQKETIRKFVTAYLVKYEGFRTVTEIVDFLKENCSQTPIKKEFTEICNITNSGIKLTTVTQYVRTYLNNIQERDVSTRSMFPDGNIRLTVYKQTPYPDLLKLFKKDIDSLSDGDKKELAIALNDPSSILFNSVLDLVEQGTKHSFKTVTNIIENIPHFNINTHKNGKTILMTAVLVLLNSINALLNMIGTIRENEKAIKMHIDFLISIVQYKNYYKPLDPTLPYSTKYAFGREPESLIRVTPVSLLLYIVVRYNRVFPTSLIGSYSEYVVNPLIMEWKLPNFYIDGLKCPGKCYGTIEKQDGTTVVLDNIWILTSLSIPSIKFLIKSGNLDLNAGYANMDLSNTFYFKIKNMETEKKELENKSEALQEEINPLLERLNQLTDELRTNHKKVLAVSNDLTKLNTLYTTFKNESIF